MCKKVLVSLAAGLFLLGMVGSANADLITNGDFSTLDITGWTLTGGQFPQASLGYFVVFENSDWAILSQDIITTPGQQYNISFDTRATPNPGNEFAWTTNGGSSLNYITRTTDSWITTNDIFTATGGITNVALYMATNPGTGLWNLDNVSVESASPVPEPTTMLLFGTGLVGLVGRSRRKRK